jgi:hypothetical protein
MRVSMATGQKMVAIAGAFANWAFRNFIHASPQTGASIAVPYKLAKTAAERTLYDLFIQYKQSD